MNRETRKQLQPQPHQPTYLPNPQQNHRPRPLHPPLIHPSQHLLEPHIIPLHHLPSTKEPHDPWTLFKRAEHDRDAAVLVDVRDGLAAGARGVDVGGAGRAEDGEGRRGQAFGRDVDVRAREGRGGGEEDGLGQGLEGWRWGRGLDDGVFLDF